MNTILKTSNCIAIAGLGLLMGCATPPAGTPQVTRTFNQPYDKVWSAVVASVPPDYPLQVIEKASGVIQTQEIQLGEAGKSYGFPPAVFLGIWGYTKGRLSINVTSEEAERTSVRLIGHFEGHEINMTHDWYVWPSRGVLETSLMDEIGNRLTVQENEGKRNVAQ
jgi:hypothetical protein